MRDLSGLGEFDAVLCWSTSFGYFDDAGNRTALAEMVRVLRPGGPILIGHQNRDFVLRTYLTMLEPGADEPSPPRFVTERGDDVEIDRIEYDHATGRLITHRLIVREGHVKRQDYVLRLFSFTEIADWLQTAGIEDVRVWGDQGGPLTLRSRKMYVRGSKAATLRPA
jgi:SAM-dependent methyltransferase